MHPFPVHLRSDGAVGTFYEGVMTKGYSTNATDAAVQSNIVAVKHRRRQLRQMSHALLRRVDSAHVGLCVLWR